LKKKQKIKKLFVMSFALELPLQQNESKGKRKGED